MFDSYKSGGKLLGFYIENLENSLATDNEKHRFITIEHKKISKKKHFFIENHAEEDKRVGVSFGEGCIEFAWGLNRYSFGIGWWDNNRWND